jgi:hypothetical protein
VATGDPVSVAAQAARGFLVLQCEDCANRIRDALLAAGHSGQWIEIRGAGRRDFMVCISYDGGKNTITQNGRHVGIRVGDVMFDNLHPDGTSYDQWLGDFDALGGIEVTATINF